MLSRRVVPRHEMDPEVQMGCDGLTLVVVGQNNRMAVRMVAAIQAVGWSERVKMSRNGW
jgi:hypothetical protein